MKRNILSTILMITLAISMTACGGNNAKDAAGSNVTVQEETTAEDKEAEPASAAGEDAKETDDEAASDDMQTEDEAAASAGEVITGGLPDDEEKSTAEESSEDSQGSDTDLSGLTPTHGRAYVYNWIGNEYLSDGDWEFSECDGTVKNGDVDMQRTLTVYRFSNSSSVEYMLEYEGEWGEFWHVSDDYDPDCTYFDYVEGGTVTLSGDRAIWEPEYGGYKEVYSLAETHEFDN